MSSKSYFSSAGADSETAGGATVALFVGWAGISYSSFMCMASPSPLVEEIFFSSGLPFRLSHVAWQKLARLNNYKFPSLSYLSSLDLLSSLDALLRFGRGPTDDVLCPLYALLLPQPLGSTLFLVFVLLRNAVIMSGGQNGRDIRFYAGKRFVGVE